MFDIDINIIGEKSKTTKILLIYGVNILWCLIWMIIFGIIHDLPSKECTTILNNVEKNYIFSLNGIIFWGLLILHQLILHFWKLNEIFCPEIIKMITIFVVYLIGLILYICLSVAYEDDKNCNNVEILDIALSHIIAASLIYGSVALISIGGLLYSIFLV